MVRHTQPCIIQCFCVCYRQAEALKAAAAGTSEFIGNFHCHLHSQLSSWLRKLILLVLLYEHEFTCRYPWTSFKIIHQHQLLFWLFVTIRFIYKVSDMCGEQHSLDDVFHCYSSMSNWHIGAVHNFQHLSIHTKLISDACEIWSALRQQSENLSTF